MILMFQQMRFINRNAELEFLESRYNSKTSELIVIYGRRRIGKTELVLEFSRKHPHVYFLATEVPIEENLRSLQVVMARYLKDSLFELARFETWESLFSEFLNRKGKEKVIIIIDEFPYLISAYRPIVSIFQKIWDTMVRKRNDVMLILCGSSIGMMETEVLGYKSPLYGRRTGQWKVEELEFSYLKAFFPQHTFSEHVKFYGIVGGTPGYLTKLDPMLTFEENLRKNVITKGSYLYEEAEMLLKQELRMPNNYFAILQAIAAGKHRYGEIVNETNLDKSLVSKYLVVLQRLGLIKKVLPVNVSVKKKIRSKKGLYYFSDNYFAFWFRFIFPFKYLLESNQMEEYLVVFNRDFESYIGTVFESLMREQFLKKLIRAPFKEVGRWWHKDTEIDIVGVTLDNRCFFIEVKWSELSAKRAHQIIKSLERKMDAFICENKQFGIIGKKIEGKSMIREKGYYVWDIDDLKAL